VRTPLLVVTTNNERRLPDAFIRRCVDLSIELPQKPTLIAIANIHFADELAAYRKTHPDTTLLEDVADAVMNTKSYSTAEYLDTVRSVLNLKVDESSESYAELSRLTVRKSSRAVGQ
jgi:MoxR-like ATPase